MLKPLKAKTIFLLIVVLFLVSSSSMVNAQSNKTKVLEFINNQDKIFVKNNKGIHVYHKTLDKDNNAVFVDGNIDLNIAYCCPEYASYPKTVTFTTTELVYVKNPANPKGGSWVPCKVKITVCYYCGDEKSRKYLG